MSIRYKDVQTALNENPKFTGKFIMRDRVFNFILGKVSKLDSASCTGVTDYWSIDDSLLSFDQKDKMTRMNGILDAV